MFYRLPDFKYVRPPSLGEALKMLAELEEARPLAGGTDLLVDMKIGRLRPKHVVDICSLPDLRYVRREGGVVKIGACATIQEVADHPAVAEGLPLLREALLNMASWQIRAVATVAGNLANASPAADSAPPLYALGAKARLLSARGERELPVEGLLLGPRKTALERGEIIAEIEVPVDEAFARHWGYRKVGRRSAFTLSVVSAAVALKLEGAEVAEARIALNAVAPRPVRARAAEEFLVGKRLTEEAIAEAAKLVTKDISPITDVRATAEYRRHISVVVVRDLLLTIARGAGGR